MSKNNKRTTDDPRCDLKFESVWKGGPSGRPRVCFATECVSSPSPVGVAVILDAATGAYGSVVELLFNGTPTCPPYSREVTLEGEAAGLVGDAKAVLDVVAFHVDHYESTRNVFGAPSSDARLYDWALGKYNVAKCDATGRLFYVYKWDRGLAPGVSCTPIHVALSHDGWSSCFGGKASVHISLASKDVLFEEIGQLRFVGDAWRSWDTPTSVLYSAVATLRQLCAL